MPLCRVLVRVGVTLCIWIEMPVRIWSWAMNGLVISVQGHRPGWVFSLSLSLSIFFK